MGFFKKLFTKKEKYKSINIKDGYGEILYENDHTTLVHDSCRICYNKEVTSTFEERIKYISSKIKVGHESILEHSNVIIKLVLNKSCIDDLIEVLNHTRYLNVITKKLMDNSTSSPTLVIISGSIRGYKHIFRNIKTPTNENKVLSILLELMYLLPSCYFVDFIEDGIMEASKFKDIDSKIVAYIKDNRTGEIIESFRNEINSIISRPKFDILNIDEVDKIFTNLQHTCIFDMYELMDMVTITVKFKGVSRTASHQLVRHRAGITQLSQRYVDMTNCKFLSPDEFKDEIDANKKYTIKLTGREKKLTLKELGDLINGVYPQLIEQGLLKEDARSFLASNTETTLYMTFTFRNFIKFLELRTHKSAQAEIRMLANELKEVFEDKLRYSIGEDIYEYIEPMYKRIQANLEEFGDKNVDEVLEVVEEKVEILNNDK